MNDKSNVTSLGDMLKDLEKKTQLIELQYSMNYWDCVVTDYHGITQESKCYNHPYYAVKEIYDCFVERKT